MVNIKLIFNIALFLKINLSLSKIKLDIVDYDDLEKCNDQTKNNTNECSLINSSLKLKEDQCCRITINYDILQNLKDSYSENWKKMASHIYGFDENLSEEEIKEKYVKNKKQNVCSLMNGDEDFNNYILYESSRFSIGGKITYDCGDGEKFYKTKEYIPKQHKFKILKDTIECLRQKNETDCHNSASKFLTDDVLACWNIANYNDRKYGYPDIEKCQGYLKSEYKERFTSMFKHYINYKKFEETWNCIDKNGKKIQIYMNTITGKFKIT